MQKLKGYEIETVSGDGNCLFRSLSLGIYGTQTKHMDLRAELAEKIKNEVVNGNQNELFPLGHTYVTNHRGDDVRTLTPAEYISELSVPGTWSDEQDVVFAQKYLCEPRSIGIVMIRKNNDVFQQSFTLDVKMREYDSYIYLVCQDEIHYEVLDVGKKNGSNCPRAVLWCNAPKLFVKK